MFTQHGIPHFLDQRRSITHHPLIEFLRSAVGYAAHQCDMRDLVLLLKTGLTGVAEDRVHQFENYLLAHGVTKRDLAEPFKYGAANLAEDDEELGDAERRVLAAVNETRTLVCKKMADWMAAAATAPRARGDAGANGRALARALYGLVESCGVPEWMAELMARERGAGGDAERLMIHEQAWKQVVGLLETLERVLGESPMTLADFGAVLGAALESLTLGLIPPTVDQVLVSSVTRSRHPELKAVFILGAVETRFPLVRPEDPMLSDQQREMLNAQRAGADQRRGGA